LLASTDDSFLQDGSGADKCYSSPGLFAAGRLGSEMVDFARHYSERRCGSSSERRGRETVRPLGAIERARNCVVLLSLAATALIVFPLSYDQFILPKRVWIVVLTEISALLAALKLAAGGDFRVRTNGVTLLLLLFVLWKTLSWFWAESRSLAGDEIRWWWILFLWYLLFQDWLSERERRFRACAGALMVSALALSLWVLIQDFAIAFYQSWVKALMGLARPFRDLGRGALESLTGAGLTVAKLPDWRGHLWAGLGNTNHIADYIALLFPIAAVQYITARAKRWAVFGLGVLAVSYAALIACYSVGSNGGLILAAVVLVALFVAHEPKGFWKSRAGRLVAAGVVFGAITAFYVIANPLNPHPGGIFHQAFASERWRAGWPTRVAIWLTSFEIVRAHPLLGIGAGNFTYGYTATLSPHVLARPDLAPYAGLYTNAAHNEPLQALVETGLVGAVLLAALWIAALRSLLKGIGRAEARTRRARSVLAAMLVAFAGHSMMNFTLQLPTSTLLFVAMAAASAVLAAGGEGFPLTVRLAYPLVEIEAATVRMRRIESLGLRLAPSRAVRGTVGAAAVAAGLWAVGSSLKVLEADVLFNKAKQAKWMKADSAAENFARRALRLNPRHHHARKLLGRVLLGRGRWAEARKALEKVEERETVFDYYDELGWACWHLGDREAAGRNWAAYFGRCPQARKLDPALFGLFCREFPEKAAKLAEKQPGPESEKASSAAAQHPR